MFLMFLAVESQELSCSLQATRSSSIVEHPTEQKATKHLRRKSGLVSNGKLQDPKGSWEISFDCHNPLVDKNVVEKFTCGSEYNKLKFVFLQNKKVSSTFIDLQPSLFSFNKFRGLDLRNLTIKAESRSCEIWIESASFVKAFVALVMAWVM